MDNPDITTRLATRSRPSPARGKALSHNRTLFLCGRQCDRHPPADFFRPAVGGEL